MLSNIRIDRTATSDPNFQLLVQELDHELWNELKEDQKKYDQFNKVPDIRTAVILYLNNEPAAIGCFKRINNEVVEIKRMFVRKNFRGQGFSKLVLQELERWAMEEGYQEAVLETSIHFTTAKNLYLSNGYQTILNYGPYVDLAESVCMKKQFV